jgi:hypothetical protein
MSRGGWRALRSFPVEGDSAEYELWLDGELFALLWLDGIDLNAHGRDRTKNARVMVNFFERRPSERAGAKELVTLTRREAARPFGAAFDEAAELLREGRDWLFENEQGRVPLG